MYIEYACYEELMYDSVRANVFKAIDLGVHGISVPTSYMSTISTFIPSGISLSCPIDYPNGRSDNQLRIHAALKAYNQGATAIDVVANMVLFSNGQLHDFAHDIKNLKSLAADKGMTIRVMADYRKTDEGEKFRELLKLIRDCGIDFIFCSTGYHVDDYSDNVLYSQVAQKKYGFSAIANGNLFLPSHLELARSSGIFGVRFHHVTALENCLIGV